MSSRFFLAVVLCLGAAQAPVFAATDPALPEPLPSAHFDRLVRKSPFAPATPPTPKVETPEFAANLYISSVSAIGDQYLVGISSREQPNKIFLMSGETGEGGLTIERVDYSPEVGKSRVVLRKGTETATVEFDQAALQKNSAQAAAQQPATQLPHQHAGARGIAPQATGPTRPNMPQSGYTGGRRRVLPRQHQIQPGQPGSTVQPNPGQQPRESRRSRVRVIPSRPTQ